jgi:MFS family permease
VKKKLLFIIFSVSLFAVLGLTSVNPAFPKMSEELGVKGSEIGLIISVFTLPGIILTFIFGILSDRFGRKIILSSSLVLYGVTGFFCSLTNNFNILLILRFLEGIGASSLGAMNVILIADFFSDAEQHKILGYNNSVLNLGTAAFPVLGGFLAGYSWKYIFYLPLAAVPVGIWIWFALPENQERKKINFKKYFLDIYHITLKNNLLPVLVISLFSFIILFSSYLTYMPFLLKSKFNSSPLIIGICLSTVTVSTAIISIFYGRISEIFSYKNIFIFIFITYALSIFLMPFVTQWWLILFPAILFGIAHGINLPHIQNYIIRRINPEHRGGIISLNRSVSQLGQSLGPILGGIIYALDPVKGVRWVFFAASLNAILILFFLLAFIKQNSD